MQELQHRAEKTELLQMELQMLETERVRLSLVEEKLVDILQLLQQLRDLVSRSASRSCTCPLAGPVFVAPNVVNSRNDCRVKLKSAAFQRKPSAWLSFESNPPTQ